MMQRTEVLERADMQALSGIFGGIVDTVVWLWLYVVVLLMKLSLRHVRGRFPYF